MAAILDLTPTRSRFFTSSTMLYLLLLFAERFRSGFKAVSRWFQGGSGRFQSTCWNTIGTFRAVLLSLQLGGSRTVSERFQSGFRAIETSPWGREGAGRVLTFIASVIGQ